MKSNIGWTTLTSRIFRQTDPKDKNIANLNKQNIFRTSFLFRLSGLTSVKAIFQVSIAGKHSNESIFMIRKQTVLSNFSAENFRK